MGTRLCRAVTTRGVASELGRYSRIIDVTCGACVGVSSRRRVRRRVVVYSSDIGDVVTTQTVGRAVTTVRIADARRIVLGGTLVMLGRVTVAACVVPAAEGVYRILVTVDALVGICSERRFGAGLEVFWFHLGLVTELTLEAVVCGRGLRTRDGMCRLCACVVVGIDRRVDM